VTRRSLVSGFILTALLTLSTATSASAQNCPFLSLTTQAEVDAVSCSRVIGNVQVRGPTSQISTGWATSLRSEKACGSTWTPRWPM